MNCCHIVSGTFKGYGSAFEIMTTAALIACTAILRDRHHRNQHNYAENVSHPIPTERTPLQDPNTEDVYTCSEMRQDVFFVRSIAKPEKRLAQ